MRIITAAATSVQQVQAPTTNPITVVGATLATSHHPSSVAVSTNQTSSSAVATAAVVISPSTTTQHPQQQQQTVALPTLVSSQPMTITTKQLKVAGTAGVGSTTVVSTLPASSFTATSQQALRVVSAGVNSSGGTLTNTPIRVLSSGQTVRLATSQTGTILRGQTSIMTTAITPGTVGTTTTSATIGGKQILLQKPINIGQNLLQLVKTSQGMTVVQKAGTTSVSGGQISSSGGQTITVGGNSSGSGGVTGTTTGQILTTGVSSGGQKTALIGGNVVKLMTPAAVSGNKILMKNSNLMQVGKMTTNAAGKPAFVITNKQGQQIRTNQQIIFVTTAGGLRSVQTGNIVTSANNFVSLVTTSQMNTLTSATATGLNSVSGLTTAPPGTVKMIRGVGKPITFTLPVGGLQGNKSGGQQIISMPQKGLTIGGKAVTVQLAPGAGGQKTVTILSSAAASGVQKSLPVDLQPGHKIVMVPTKRNLVSNVITTHKAISIPSAASIGGGGGSNTDAPVVTTDAALAALAAETGLMEANHSVDGNEQHIEQMDGAVDDSMISPSETDDDEDYEDIIIKHTNPSVIKKQKEHYGINRMTNRENRIKKKATKFIKPRYVKMGLFGGAPTITTTTTVSLSATTSTTTNSPSVTTMPIASSAATVSSEPEGHEDNVGGDGQTSNDNILKANEDGTEHHAQYNEGVSDGDRDHEMVDMKHDTDDANALQQHSISALNDHQMSGEGESLTASGVSASGTGETTGDTSTEYMDQSGSAGDDNHHQQKAIESGNSHNTQQQRIDEPTASETEAANILTIIKSGELLLSRPADTHDSNTTTTSSSSTIQTQHDSGDNNANDGNVKILFNNEPHITTNQQQSATTSNTKLGTAATTITAASNNSNKSQQIKNVTTSYSSNTGHLDALASAALQASSQKQNFIVNMDNNIVSGAGSVGAGGGGVDGIIQLGATSTISTKQKGVVRHKRTSISEAGDEVSILHTKIVALFLILFFPLFFLD